MQSSFFRLRVRLKSRRQPGNGASARGGAGRVCVEWVFDIDMQAYRRMYRPKIKLAAVLVAMLAVLGLAAGGPASAQSASPVVVQGNRGVEADTIRSYFGRDAGEQLDAIKDAAKVDSALKALYATGRFADVRIARTDGQLIVTVVENRILDRVAFEGNRKLKDDELKALVQSKQRGPLSRPTVQADVVRILDAYQHGGRFDTRVEPKIIELAENRADLVFEIHESKKVGVRDIVFVGNRTFSANRLKGEIKTGQTNPLSFLLNNDLYDADRLEGDRDLLRRFYLKRGFAQARVVSAEGRYDAAKDGIVVPVSSGDLPISSAMRSMSTLPCSFSTTARASVALRICGGLGGLTTRRLKIGPGVASSVSMS